MNKRVINRRLRRLELGCPGAPVETLPAEVAAIAIDAGLAVAGRTGKCGGGVRLTVVDHAMLFVLNERMTNLERGDVGPWIRLCDSQTESLSMEPAAVAELERILTAVGFDLSEPQPAEAPRRSTLYS